MDYITSDSDEKLYSPKNTNNYVYTKKCSDQLIQQQIQNKEKTQNIEKNYLDILCNKLFLSMLQETRKKILLL